MNVLSTSMLSASIQDIIGKNVSLRSRVLEEEDSIMSLLESAVSFTQLKPKAMKSRVDSSNDAVFSTERNYNCGTTYKVSYQDLASHTPLEISAEAVESCLAYSVPDTVVVRRTLKEMVNDGTLKAPKSVQVQRRDMFRNLDGAMGSEVSTTIYNLYDCANQDVLQYTKDEVAKFDTEVSRLQRAIATEESMRRHFIEAQDYNSGDIHHVNKVDLESRLLAQYNQRLKIIVASASSSGSVTDSLTTVRQDAFDAVKAIEDEKRDMLANIDKDLASLGDLRTQQKAMQDETMSHHEQTWKKLNDFIATNTREQDTLWSEIEERALALHQNGKRRADRMKQFLDHKHRVVEATGMFETMMRVSAEYMKMLESLRSHADQCVVICGHIQEYCNDMVDVLTKRNIKKQLDDIAIAEAHAYAAVYADFVTDVGDLRTKKEQRVECVRREQRALKLNVEVAPMALDPEVASYERRIVVLEEQAEELSKHISKFESISKKASEDFEVCRVVLGEEKGMEFEDPEIKVTENNAAKRKNLTEKTIQYLNKEKELLNDAQTQIEETLTSVTMKSPPRPKGEK